MLNVHVVWKDDKQSEDFQAEEMFLDTAGSGVLMFGRYEQTEEGEVPVPEKVIVLEQARYIDLNEYDVPEKEEIH